MPPTLRHIPFRKLAASGLHLRYLEGDRDLVPFLGLRPRNADEVLKRAPRGARRLIAPGDLAAAATAYGERYDAPEQSLAAARSLGESDTMVVVTGQQPGLLGGPLYSLHKAATAVRLAQAVSARPGAPKVVPVFWNHTDDHDLDEVNRAFLVNRGQEVQRFRLDLEHTGEAIRHIPVGRKVEGVLGGVQDLLPDSEFRDWGLGPFLPKHPDEHLGEPMARMLFRLFGNQGLVVLEPRDLPQDAFSGLSRWWEQADHIRSLVRSVGDHLGDLGVDVTMDPGATMMFQLQGGQRVALADGEAPNEIGDLSPGALLRPLWQDACLPSLGFVVGPGELAYLSMVGPLYRELGVPQPTLVPRASLTLVQPPQQKLLSRFGWDLDTLGKGPEALAASLVEEEDEGGLDEEIERIALHLRDQLSEVGRQLKRVDPQVVGACDRARNKAVDEIEKLAAKVRNSRQNREGTGMRQVRKLCNHLRPRGRLQERVLSPLPYMVAHGPELADTIVDAADPFATHHGILEL